VCSTIVTVAPEGEARPPGLRIRAGGHNRVVDTCSHCGGPLPENASFCPSCGRRTNAPPVAAREVPIDVQHAEPRYFGLGTPVFALGAAFVLLALGVVLLLAGKPAAGVIAIVFGLVLLPVFLAGARRWPDSSVARIGVGAADRVRDEAGVAVESISTWSRAGRDVARLRKQQFQLRRERDATIRQLGPAFYAGDGGAETLRASAKELDEQIAANDRELQRTIARARRHTRKERATVVATEVRQPEPVAELAPEPPAEDEPLTRGESEIEVEQPKPRNKRQARSR
jgi:hypothetical protein